MVALTRAVEPADAFLIAGLLPVVMLIAGIGVLRLGTAGTRPFEALLIPAVLTGGAGAAIHLVPIGLGLVPILLGFAFLLDRILALELRLLGQSTSVTEADRSRVVLAAVVTAFVAFTGIATLVPGGLAEPGGTPTGGTPMTEGWLVVLALNDALVALVLGYRAGGVPLRDGDRRGPLRRDVRDHHRDHGRRGAGGRPAAARGARRAHAGVLPLGRAPRLRARPAVGSPGSCGRRSCWSSSPSSWSPGTCGSEPDRVAARPPRRASDGPSTFDGAPHGC